MGQPNRCAICGFRKPDDAPFGFCPNCLFGGLIEFVQHPDRDEAIRGADALGDRPNSLGSNVTAAQVPVAGFAAPADRGVNADACGAPGPVPATPPPTTERHGRDAEESPPTPSTDPASATGSVHVQTPTDVETVKLAGYYHALAQDDAAAGMARPAENRHFPKVVGYEIQGVLGVGGMGVVYKALQVRADRLVALKMIRGDAHVSFEQLERFRVEARAVAQLRHPNIVQIFDVGEAGHLPYFSIELLDGGTLRDRLAAGPMPHRAAAELMAVLARAVHSAHSAGIVHRDLKPANVLFDTDGTPKVTDFGLAKRLEEEGQTITGQVVGTPSYMAPEQARGESRSVGPLADVYALGAILYTALTGRPPFRGVDVTETLYMVLFHDPVAPSKLRPKVPRDLETICLKCLLKEPAKRYASARGLEEDLDRYLAGRPITARRTPVWERAAKWARRRPLSAAALIVGIVSAIGLGAAAAANVRQENRRLAKVESQVLGDLSRTRGLVADGKLGDALGTLKSDQDKLASERRLDNVRRLVDDAVLDVQHRIDDERHRGDEVKANSAAQQRFAQFRERRDEALFRDGYAAFFADESLEPGESGTPGSGAAVRDTKVVSSRRDEQTRLTRGAARDALDVFEIAVGAPSPGVKDAAARLTREQRAELNADCYLISMVLSEATAQPLRGEDPARQAREALQWLDRAAALHAPTRAFHLRRAAYLEHSGDAPAAQVERTTAMDLEPVEAFDHFLLGRELSRDGDWAAADQHLEAAIRLQPDSFWSHCLLATVELNQRPPRAAEARKELIDCVRQHPDYAWLYLLRGLANGYVADASSAAARASTEPGAYAEKARSRFEEAEADFQKALELGLDESLNYALLTNRGVMRFQQGKLEAAAADFERAIALRKERYNAYVSLAQVDRKRGRRAAAIARIDTAISLQPETAVLYRARALARLDDEALAGADAEAALGDLETAARLAALNRRETARAAEDHARRGRLLLRLHRPADALAAADTALGLAEALPQAHLVRVSALMQMERYDDVIDACAAALKANPRGSSELYRVRGLARVVRNDFAGAIEDYTQALALQPDDRAEVYRNRGWSYIYANSFDLARRDFEAVLRLDSNDTESYAGRAAALARMGRVRDACADIERSLRPPNPSPRVLFIATQVYSLAAARAADEASRHGRPASRESLAYEARAANLLGACLEKTPAARRTTFWRDVVTRDPVLVPLLRNPTIVQRLEPREATSP